MGKTKIVYALRQKKVSEQNIKKGLKEIGEADYSLVLQKLAEAKWKSLAGEQYLAREAKTSAYLIQKGYESPAVRGIIRKIRTGVAG